MRRKRSLARAVTVAAFLLPAVPPAVTPQGHGTHPHGHAVEPPETAAGFVTEWREPSRRPALASLAVPATDQTGAAVTLKALADRPMALAFFYTRCDNPYRCALTVNAMARLQRSVEAAGLADEVRLVLVTYEPENDTPGALERYGADRGFRFGPGAAMLRPEPGRKMELLDELAVPVNFSAGWVNVHGLGLYLLDRSGRHVRTYHTLIWDDGRVVEDLRRLAGE